MAWVAPERVNITAAAMVLAAVESATPKPKIRLAAAFPMLLYGLLARGCQNKLQKRVSDTAAAGDPNRGDQSAGSSTRTAQTKNRPRAALAPSR